MAPILVFDIPLLFESSDYKWLDKIIVVTVNVKSQEARVLKRGKMTREQFFELNSKQMPIEEKKKTCRLCDTNRLWTSTSKKASK